MGERPGALDSIRRRSAERGACRQGRPPRPARAGDLPRAGHYDVQHEESEGNEAHEVRRPPVDRTARRSRFSCRIARGGDLVMPRKLVLIAVLTAALVVSGRAQQPSSLASLKTTAEASDFKSTSTYDDVVKFMKAVDDASPLVFYTTYGTTYEGRPMPMAVVGTGLKDASPASVKGSGKLRVHIQANIHAGEVEGKESAQILLRQLAMGQHADWLRSMVLLVTPIFNADGNEKFALNNRGRQNGPINGQGTRANGQGWNINRDFMRLDTPEAQAFVKLWNDYDPQVGYDLHTSDGSAEGYVLTYAPGLNPDTSDAITGLMKDEWFSFVTKNINSKYGWETFYYGGPGGGGRGRGGAAPGGDRGAAAGGAAGGGRGAGGGGAAAGAGAGAGGAVTGAVPTP